MRSTYKGLLALYLIILGFAVFTPRHSQWTLHPKLATNSSSNVNPSVGHHILYESGVWAWIGNFFLLIPVVILTQRSWPKLGYQTIFIITLFITITIEYIQVYIPGRVSNVSDIIFNGSGSALTLLFLHRQKTSKNRAPK